MHSFPEHITPLVRFWPAFVGAAVVYALWPLVWLGISASTLSQQEAGANELFAAAPAVYLTGTPHHFQEGGLTGRYLLKSRADVERLFVQQGWRFTNQMGGGTSLKNREGGLPHPVTCFPVILLYAT
ncbi:hypothetical protein ACFP81_03290 [Deinococcus lacus]|uniref:Uncharacterized protein n=1 Tax=Deinococcus lacus TaxID=392561 RepID=A0ABW1YCD2_9DEIO